MNMSRLVAMCRRAPLCAIDVCSSARGPVNIAADAFSLFASSLFAPVEFFQMKSMHWVGIICIIDLLVIVLGRCYKEIYLVDQVGVLIFLPHL